ncbi:MAG TPA: glycoside hydrolase family 28 protein [Verrucomicrobiae bacterium]|nr:glycoside hydrolase family 28 protein [Verrucomicrobiae bacterium]
MKRRMDRHNQQSISVSTVFRFLRAMVLILGIGIWAVAPQSSFAGSKTYDVRAFGAKGDGKTLDTEAIQKALDECGNAGGGTVLFRAGTYVSEPLTLRTKTTVLLEEGAKLLATSNQAAFLKSGTDWLQAESSSDFVPFISGKRLTDVTITGKGIIDGNGQYWWPAAEEARQKRPGYTLPRPNLIVLNYCKNVRLEKITLQNSPKFHFVPTDSEGVVVDGVTILAPPRAANTDAIDPSRCKNVLITKCLIDVGDDNVAIKSGKKIPEREFACEDITVSDCTFRHGHGMSIGSEVVGGVRNVTVKNCTFEGTENGLRIKSRRGKGGKVENIAYTDITMKNVNPAILLSCSYGGTSAGDAVQVSAAKAEKSQAVTETTPIYRNIYIRNVTATAEKSAGVIEGLPESPISNVVLENVHITSATGLKVENAKGIQLKNTQITTKEGPPCILLENAQVEGLEKIGDKK